MADNTTPLGNKWPIISGSEHIRDSDIIERIVEGTMYVGDLCSKGTAETQAVATTETSVDFLGICLGHSIRQSDTETYATALTAGKYAKFLKPTGGRVGIRSKFMGYTTGATVPSGSPVYFNGVGSTIGANDSQLGKAYADPAQAADTQAQIGWTKEAIALPDCTTNSEDVEGEFFY